MQRRWGLIILSLAVMILAGSAFAHAGDPGQNRAKAAGDRLVAELGITQEQAAKIRAIFTEPDEALGRLQKAVKIARLRLSLAMEEDDPEAKLAALLKEYEAAVKPCKEYQAARIRKAFEVLTIKQRCKLAVMDREDWWRIFLGRPSANGR